MKIRYNSFGQLYTSRGREKSNIVESGKKKFSFKYNKFS